jgi:hypothetical protein
MAPIVKFNVQTRQAFKRNLDRAIGDGTYAAGVVYLRQLRKEISVSVRVGPSAAGLEFDESQKGLIESRPKDTLSTAAKVKGPAKIKSSSTPKTGKKKRRKGVKITRSRPGEPPRRETGNLFRSWNVRPAQGNKAEVFSDKRAEPYNIKLETGTPKMKPRPYIVATFEKSKQRMNSAATLAISRKLN